jgi:hypothetical protein
MPDPSNLRDSTQIVLPSEELDGLRADMEAEFTVTVYEMDGDDEAVDYLRIIGSPVVIKRLSEYLTRHGVSLP